GMATSPRTASARPFVTGQRSRHRFRARSRRWRSPTRSPMRLRPPIVAATCSKNAASSWTRGPPTAYSHPKSCCRDASRRRGGSAMARPHELLLAAATSVFTDGEPPIRVSNTAYNGLLAELPPAHPGLYDTDGPPLWFARLALEIEAAHSDP